MRNPRTGRVSKSGQHKIERALARGWRIGNGWTGIAGRSRKIKFTKRALFQ
jgi:hypothetical protein